MSTMRFVNPESRRGAARIQLPVVLLVLIACIVLYGCGSSSKSTSKSKSTPTTAKSSAAVKTAFGSRASAACPTLRQWQNGYNGYIYVATAKVPWPQQQAAIVKQLNAMHAAHTKLIPLAQLSAKIALQRLDSALVLLTAKTQQSASAAAYAANQKAVMNAEQVNYLKGLRTVAQSC
jgi:uncharacterized protein YceK